MSGLKRMAAWLAAHKERLGILAVGLLGNAVMIWGFDFILYPFVIWKLGPIKGGIIMTFLSLTVCYLTILFYDWAKKDWLGIELLKGLKEYSGNNKLAKITSWIMKRGDVAAMLFLSLRYDPFIATVYMRHGANRYNGMSHRDWKIFLTSVIIANIWWILVSFGAVSVIKCILN